jgi:hypothetical protein
MACISIIQLLAGSYDFLLRISFRSKKKIIFTRVLLIAAPSTQNFWPQALLKQARLYDNIKF